MTDNTDINPFAEDWQDCLRAHYTHVVREQDSNNEESLITVLMDTGFTEADIHRLRQMTVGSADSDIDTAEYADDTAYSEAIIEEELTSEVIADVSIDDPIEVSDIDTPADEAIVESEIYNADPLTDASPESAEAELEGLTESIPDQPDAILDESMLPDPVADEISTEAIIDEPDAPIEPDEPDEPENFTQMSLF